MAHASGWIEAYQFLEDGRALPGELRARVLGNRNAIGETMLHWYCIEGEPDVVEKIIELGFDLNTTNEFGRTPLFECVRINRWDIVELLLRHGADTGIKDQNDEDIFEHLEYNEEHSKVARLKELTKRCS